MARNLAFRATYAYPEWCPALRIPLLTLVVKPLVSSYICSSQLAVAVGSRHFYDNASFIATAAASPSPGITWLYASSVIEMEDSLSISERIFGCTPLVRSNVAQVR